MNIESLIVIVTYNSQDFIGKCLFSIISQTYKDWFLIIIDSASTDSTTARVREFRNMYPEINAANFKLIALKKNIGFAAAVNHAVFNFIAGKESISKEYLQYLILLNPDIYLNLDALKEIISSVKIINEEKLPTGKIGAAGGLILDYNKDTIQHLGGKISDNFITFHINFGKNYSDLKKEQEQERDKSNDFDQTAKIRDVDYITGAFIITELGLFKGIGGLDDGYRPLYFEELDYCLKVKKLGWRVVTDSHSIVRHFEGASVKKFSRNFYKFYHKNRIRCAVINLGFLDFFKKFFGAEARWIRNKATGDQFFPLFYAYFINLIFLPYNLIIKLKNHLILNKLELK